VFKFLSQRKYENKRNLDIISYEELPENFVAAVKYPLREQRGQSKFSELCNFGSSAGQKYREDDNLNIRIMILCRLYLILFIFYISRKDEVDFRTVLPPRNFLTALCMLLLCVSIITMNFLKMSPFLCHFSRAKR